MDKEKKGRILAVPFPSHGHINPMMQLCKRLVCKGLKATLTLTKFYGKKNMKEKSGLIQIETISDGDDEYDIFDRQSVPDSVVRFTKHGSESIAQLIEKYESLGDPIVGVIYDSLLPWVVEVPKKFGLVAIEFFTQHSGVNLVEYHYYHKLIPYPVESPVTIPGLPLLQPEDVPSYGVYLGNFTLMASQFSTVDKADFAVVNTFYKMEEEALEAMSKFCPMMPVGPTIPSFYLDNFIENDKEYGLSVPRDDSICINWLNTKPEGSVVYVSLSSVIFASPDAKQMEELAFGLKGSNYNFLWIVKDFEVEKLPKNFAEETSDKSLIVQWCPQLEVLLNKAVGCIVSHCGWNSVLEALSIGVPIVGMPVWADQPTTAKFIQDVWKVGVRVKRDENGIAGRGEIEGCIRKVMEGGRTGEIKENCIKWKTLAKEAVSEGGTSDTNLNKLVSKLTSSP
ncbi:UDP-glycosyltransferase 74F2-like [Olea europaea var. sylvestris]|uniref:UDP-glycosyltransferase 74F2-like n=1 Tax=Olea europaea var. sylvestris TaxID=158386 RepID=UPI000C1D2D66|nr:UDP-glycosyltransferase 74F2-like [Olea europaea var. sylvestris]